MVVSIAAATAALEALKLCLAIAVLLLDGRSRALDQRCLEPGGAFSQTRGLALAGALVLARTQTSPCDEMPSRGEAGHIRGDFGQDRLCRQSVDAWNAGQQADQGAKEGLTALLHLIHLIDRRVDLLVDRSDRRGQDVVLCKMQPQPEAMVISQPTWSASRCRALLVNWTEGARQILPPEDCPMIAIK